MTLDSRKLNVGCWERREEGWLNLDVYRRPGNAEGAEVIGDVRALPFEDGAFDAVFMSHILEHIPETDVTTAMSEVRRVLRPLGQFAIVGPDYDRAEAAWLSQEIDTDFRPLIWGIDPNQGGFRQAANYVGQSSELHEGADHLWCATGPKTLDLVTPIFPNAREVKPSDVFDDPSWISTCPDDRWQFAIWGRKERK